MIGRLLTILIALLLLLVLSTSLYVTREDQQMIILQFGEPRGDAITEPGLHFKAPYQRALQFDKRFLEWNGKSEALTTKDKKYIFVDIYARWRISNPLLFYQRLRDESGAQSRLDGILDGETRNAVARHNLLEVVRSSNRTPLTDESNPEESAFETIESGRDSIREEILKGAKSSTADLGIEVLDVQFRRINYSDSRTQQAVFERMISERKRIADRFRSEGQGEAARILGEMDRELKRIQSEAYRTAEEIRGRADAEATQIYASAYNRSADSRAFYEFLKTMESLERTIDSNTWLMLSTSGDFYKFLKGDSP